MNLITIEEKTSYGEFKYAYVADDLTVNTVGLTLVIKFYDVVIKRFITKTISLNTDTIIIRSI